MGGTAGTWRSLESAGAVLKLLDARDVLNTGTEHEMEGVECDMPFRSS